MDRQRTFSVCEHCAVGRVEREHHGVCTSRTGRTRVDLAPSNPKGGVHRGRDGYGEYALKRGRRAQRRAWRNRYRDRNLVAGGAALGHRHARGCVGDRADRRRDLGCACIGNHITNNRNSCNFSVLIAREGDVLVREEGNRRVLPGSAGAARRAVSHLVDACGVPNAWVRSHDAQGRGLADPDGVRRLDVERCAGDIRVVRGRGIVRPHAAAVAVLPLRH